MQYKLTDRGENSVREFCKTIEKMQNSTKNYATAFDVGFDTTIKPPTVEAIENLLNEKGIDQQEKCRIEWPYAKRLDDGKLSKSTLILSKGCHFVDSEEEKKQPGYMTVGELIDQLQKYSRDCNINLRVGSVARVMYKNGAVAKKDSTLTLSAGYPNQYIYATTSATDADSPVKAVESVPMTLKEQREAYRAKVRSDIEYALDHKIQRFEFNDPNYRYNTLAAMAKEEAARLLRKRLHPLVKKALQLDENREIKKYIHESWVFSLDYVRVTSHKGNDRTHVYIMFSEAFLNGNIYPIIEKARRDKLAHDNAMKIMEERKRERKEAESNG